MNCKTVISLNVQIYPCCGVCCSSSSIGYRASSRVDLGDGFIPWAKENAPRLLREKEPEADKSEIKRLLKNGVTVPYASLIEESNIQIR